MDSPDVTPPTRLERDFARFRREVRVLLAIGFLLVLCAIVFGYIDSRNQREDISRVALNGLATAAQSHAALCSVKADYQRRVAETRSYLKTHPQGVAGISPADLERSIHNLKSTVESLAPLRCQKPS